MMRGWKSRVYSFYESIPIIEYVNGRKTHTFKCARRGCTYRCHRYLDSKTDRASTGNLSKHARSCWKEDAYNMAMDCGTIGEARKNVLAPFNANGNIKVALKIGGKQVTYCARNHTKAEMKFVLILLFCFLADLNLLGLRSCVGCPRVFGHSQLSKIVDSRL